MSCQDSFVIVIWEQVLPVLETSQIYHVVLNSTVELVLSARLTGQWHQTQVRDGFQCQQCRTCLYSGFVRAVRGDANNALARVGGAAFAWILILSRNWQEWEVNGSWPGLFCQVPPINKCLVWFARLKSLNGKMSWCLGFVLIGVNLACPNAFWAQLTVYCRCFWLD